MLDGSSSPRPIMRRDAEGREEAEASKRASETTAGARVNTLRAIIININSPRPHSHSLLGFSRLPSKGGSRGYAGIRCPAQSGGLLFAHILDSIELYMYEYKIYGASAIFIYTLLFFPESSLAFFYFLCTFKNGPVNSDASGQITGEKPFPSKQQTSPTALHKHINRRSQRQRP